MTADAVLTALERNTLDPKSFSHAAHGETGRPPLGETGFGNAVSRMSDALQRVTAAVGRPEKSPRPSRSRSWL